MNWPKSWFTAWGASTFLFLFRGAYVTSSIAPRRGCVVDCMKLSKIIMRAGLVILALFVFGWLAARFLIVSALPDHGDAILLLSGSSSISERTHYAASLYFQHRAPLILLTNDNQKGGWSATDNRNLYYYETARRELIRLGVPTKDIETIGSSVSSTYDESLAARQYCEGRNIQAIVLVTSAYHSRRALWTFRRTFTDSNVSIGVSSVPTGWQTPDPSAWWVSPRGWQLVAGEYVKLVYYWFSR